MISQELVSSFIKLSGAHEELTRACDSLKQHECIIDKINQEIERLSQELNSFTEKTGTIRRQITVLEREVEELSTHERGLASKLRSCKKVREYEALEEELANTSHERLSKERRLEQAWRTFESARTKEHQYTTQQNEKICAARGEVDKAEQACKHAKQEVSQLEKECEALLSQLPHEWRGRYARMLQSVHNPAVPLNGGLCGACFYAVVSRDLQKAHTGELITCNNCYRLLFSQENLERNEASKGAESCS